MEKPDWSKDWSKFADAAKHDWSKWADAAKKTDWSKLADTAQKTASTHAERFANDLHSKIKRDFESRMSRGFEAKSRRYERKMRARFNRQTQKYGGVTIDPAQDAPPPPQFKSDAERQAYERARKRATAEAGFFVHLMWYGIIIGFLFVVNLLTTPFGYQWWVWPALGWGFGVASHFSAVYGWGGFMIASSSPRSRARFSAKFCRRRSSCGPRSRRRSMS